MTDDRIHDLEPGVGAGTGATSAASRAGADADAPGSEDARTPGVDEVPGPHGVDDPDQNPPLPDWGPTDGTHGEG